MSVIENRTRRLCREGTLTLGAGVRLVASVEIGLAMKAAGYDWLFIDLEHGPFDLQTTGQVAIAALSQGITPLVRVAAPTAHLCTRALDGGAQGIVLPHCDSAEQARELVEVCRFPPDGRRSSGGGLAHAGFVPLGADQMHRGVNHETLLVAMIETPEAGDEADAIAAVDGIDVLLIGTNDLSTGMGLPGQLDHPRVNRVYAQVNEACQRHAKTAGMGGCYDPALIERRIGEGMRFILAGSDLSFVIAGARRQAESVRSMAG